MNTKFNKKMLAQILYYCIRILGEHFKKRANENSGLGAEGLQSPFASLLDGHDHLDWSRSDALMCVRPRANARGRESLPQPGVGLGARGDGFH